MTHTRDGYSVMFENVAHGVDAGLQVNNNEHIPSLNHIIGYDVVYILYCLVHEAEYMAVFPWHCSSYPTIVVFWQLNLFQKHCCVRTRLVHLNISSCYDYFNDDLLLYSDEACLNDISAELLVLMGLYTSYPLYFL